MGWTPGCARRGGRRGRGGGLLSFRSLRPYKGRGVNCVCSAMRKERAWFVSGPEIRWSGLFFRGYNRMMCIFVCPFVCFVCAGRFFFRFLLVAGIFLHINSRLLFLVNVSKRWLNDGNCANFGYFSFFRP